MIDTYHTTGVIWSKSIFLHALVHIIIQPFCQAIILASVSKQSVNKTNYIKSGISKTVATDWLCHDIVYVIVHGFLTCIP